MSTAQALTTALFQFVWQGALIALALWFALLLLQKAAASIRYAVCCLALMAMVALPAVTFYRLHTSGVESTAVASVVSQIRTVAASNSVVVPATSHWVERLQPWALPFWLLGMLLCSIRLLWTSRTIYQIRRSAETAGEGVLASVERLTARIQAWRSVRVLISQAIDSPSVVGWIRPVILLPAASLAGLEPEQLEAILAHEIAHIRRYDDVINMMQTVVEILLFYHPAVWWVSSRIRRERELCCDDVAVSVTGDRVGYARALARLERMRLAPSMALGAADDSLSYRIRRIVGEGVPSRPQTLTPAIAILCICLGLALVTANAKRMSSEPAQTASVSAPAAAITSAGPALYFFSSRGQNFQSFGMDDPGVTVDSGSSSVRHREGIAYPEAAWNKGIQGTVTVEVTTDADGRVTDARVLSGPIELRRACLQSILQWQLGADAANSTRQLAVRFDAATAKATPSRSSESPKEGLHRIETPDVSVENMYSGAYSKMMEDLQQNLRDRALDMAELKARLNDGQVQEQIQNMERDLRQSLEERAQTYAKEETQQSIEQALEQAREAMKQLRADALLKNLNGNLRLDGVFPRLRELAVGGTLTKIEFDGVPENLQNDILSWLPVKVGETLTAQSMDRITAMLDSLDPSLDLNVTRNNNNVVIRISKN